MSETTPAHCRRLILVSRTCVYSFRISVIIIIIISFLTRRRESTETSAKDLLARIRNVIIIIIILLLLPTYLLHFLYLLTRWLIYFYTYIYTLLTAAHSDMIRMSPCAVLYCASAIILYGNNIHTYCRSEVKHFRSVFSIFFF